MQKKHSPAAMRGRISCCCSPVPKRSKSGPLWRSAIQWAATGAPAYEAYLRGRHELGRRDANGFFPQDAVARARGHLERATELDPGFAPAWVELATASGSEVSTFDTFDEAVGWGLDLAGYRLVRR